MNSLAFEGVYGLGHILYLLLFIICSVFTIWYGRRIKEDDKKINIFIKIIGAILFILIITNRITVTYHDVVIEKREGYSWLNIIPNTYCGLSSIVYSLTLLFGKKNNKVLHFIVYLGFLGGVITILYPDFLESQSFLDVRSLTGLLHHGTMVIATFGVFSTRYFIPSIKKYYYEIIGGAFFVTVGAFELDALKFKKAMQIYMPLLESSPIFTSWYMVGIMFLVLLFVFLFLYERIINKKATKEIFHEMISSK